MYIQGWTMLVGQIVGIFGNILNVLVLTQKNMRQQSSSHVYLGALAVTDIFMLASAIPYAFGYAQKSSGVHSHTGFYAHYICYTNGLQAAFIVTSIWITVALTIERFIAISWPLIAKRICTPSRARKFVPLIYLFGFIVNIPSFLRFTCGYVKDPISNTTTFVLIRTPFGSHTTGTMIFHMSLLLFASLLPFILLTIFNFLLIWRLRQMSTIRQALSTEAATTNQLSRKTTIIVVAAVVVFLICNSVGALGNILAIVIGPTFYETLIWAVCIPVANLLITLNPFMNFCAYSLISSDYRNTLKNVLAGKILRNSTFHSKPSVSETKIADERSVSDTKTSKCIN